MSPEDQYSILVRVYNHVRHCNPGPISIMRDSQQEAKRDLRRLIRKLDLTIPEFIEAREEMLRDWL